MPSVPATPPSPSACLACHLCQRQWFEWLHGSFLLTVFVRCHSTSFSISVVGRENETNDFESCRHSVGDIHIFSLLSNLIAKFKGMKHQQTLRSFVNLFQPSLKKKKKKIRLKKLRRLFFCLQLNLWNTTKKTLNSHYRSSACSFFCALSYTINLVHPFLM